MTESTYQRAMVALSSHGWRRQEPGEGTAPELPSLLPKSVELLASAGYPVRTLSAQARVPTFIFEMATSRRPAVDGRRLDSASQSMVQEENPIGGGALRRSQPDTLSATDEHPPCDPVFSTGV